MGISPKLGLHFLHKTYGTVFVPLRALVSC